MPVHRPLRSLLAFCLVVACAGLADTAHAQTWTRTNGPGGGYVTSITIDPWTPATMYAGTEFGGAFKSTDAGEHWTPIGISVLVRVYDFAIDTYTPSRVYAATSVGVMRSTDAGQTWQNVRPGFYSALAIDPWTPSKVYASNRACCTSGARTTDGGDTWISSSGLTGFVVQLAIDIWNPSTVYSGGFRSIDGGLTWQQFIPSQFLGPVQAIAIDPWDSNTVYVSTPNNRLIKTSDGGVTWTVLVNTTGHVGALAVDPHVRTTVYAGSRETGMWKSIDSGASWFPIGTGLTSRNITTLTIDPATGALYVGTYDRGVFKSVDDGQTWHSTSAGITAAPVHAMALNPWAPGTLYAVGDAGVQKTVDSGASWELRNNGLVNRPTTGGVFNMTSTIANVALDVWTPDTLYVGTGDGLRKTTDGGVSWQTTGLGSQPVATVVLDIYHPGTVYAGVDGPVPANSGRLFKSVDGGAHWDPLPLDGNADVRSLAIDPANPDVLYAIVRVYTTCGGLPPSSCPQTSVVKSVNGGATWTPSSVPAQNTGNGVVAIDPTTPSTIYAAFEQSRRIFKSTDAGVQWDELPLQDTFTSIAIDPVTATTIYVSTADTGIWRSTDGGAHWEPFSNGLEGEQLDVRSLLIDPWNPGIVYAGTRYGGMFVLTP